MLICLIFSVLSTIEHYSEFAIGTLFWMVSELFLGKGWSVWLNLNFFLWARETTVQNPRAEHSSRTFKRVPAFIKKRSQFHGDGFLLDPWTMRTLVRLPAFMNLLFPKYISSSGQLEFISLRQHGTGYSIGMNFWSVHFLSLMVKIWPRTLLFRGRWFLSAWFAALQNRKFLSHCCHQWFGFEVGVYLVGLKSTNNLHEDTRQCPSCVPPCLYSPLGSEKWRLNILDKKGVNNFQTVPCNICILTTQILWSQYVMISVFLLSLPFAKWWILMS